MKNTLLLLVASLLIGNAYSQLKTTTLCPTVTVDILDGRINDLLYPSSTNGEIKGKLPCFTSAEDEAASSKCGGSVFYKDKDIYFYTGRDYIEIGEKFKGKLSIPLMGAARTNLFKWLGNPKIKDVNWEAFTTNYGTLVLYYKGGKVSKIQMSTKSTDVMSLCE